MSTIKVTNIQNPSSGTDDIQIATNGDVTIGGLSLDAAAAADSVNLDSSGRLLVGTSSARNNFYNGSTVSPSIQIEGTTYSTSSLSLVANGNAGGSNPYALLAFGRSRGTTTGSNTIVASGDTLGQISFQGNDGTEFVGCVNITAVVDGTPGANDMPGRLVFSTTADGASSPTEVMRLTSLGRLSGIAHDISRVETVAYSRVVSHTSCVSGGPTVTFTDSDSSLPSFVTVGRTVTSAPSGYTFIGDNYGNALVVFVGCGNNVVFGWSTASATAPEFRSWVCVSGDIAAIVGSLPTNTTRTSLP